MSRKLNTPPTRPIKASSKTIKSTGQAFFRIAEGISILESGIQITIQARAYLSIRMLRDMRGKCAMAGKMGRVSFIILMGEYSKESG